MSIQSHIGGRMRRGIPFELTKVSPGCKHCYGRNFCGSEFRGVKGHPYELGFDLRTVHRNSKSRWMEEAQIWFRQPMTTYFMTMCPAVHSEVARVWLRPNGTHSSSDERYERMRDLLATDLRFANGEQTHLVGRQRRGSETWSSANREPASVECRRPILVNKTRCSRFRCSFLNLSGIDWIIAGGEAGTVPDRWRKSGWFRFRPSAVDTTCPSSSNNGEAFKNQKHGRLLDGKTYDEMPTFATKPADQSRMKTGLASSTLLIHSPSPVLNVA